MANSNVADGMKEFATMFEAQLDSLRVLFFDPAHGVQLGTIKKHFAAQIGALGDSELKDLYSKFSCGSRRSDADFKQTALTEIELYLKASTASQLAQIWRDKTGSVTPDEWAATNKMPVTVLFVDSAEADLVVDVVANTSAYQTDVLKSAKSALEKARLVPSDKLAKAFEERYVSSRYAKLGLDMNALCAYLMARLSCNPNEWERLGQRFRGAIASFVREQYAQAFREKAVEKVKRFSDKEIRDRLLKLVEENPDVGLGILE